MANGVTYDDSRLTRLMEALSPAQREQALRNAFRAEARKVRKAAVKNLRGSGLKVNAEVEKGVRAVVYRQVAGFRVTIGTKGRRRSYAGMDDREKRAAKAKARLRVVPLWADAGTWKRRDKRGRNRGSMPAYPFMTKTKREMTPQVEESLRNQIVRSIERTAKRYGCTTD